MALTRYAGDKITGTSGDTKPTNVADGATFYETDTLKTYMRISGAWVLMSSAYGAIEFIIDGGGATITTGIKGDIEFPFACVLTVGRLLADQSGSISVDLWADTYANFPPTNADLVVSGFAIASSTKAEYTSLNLTVTAGKIIRFYVASCTSIQRCTLAFTVKKT